MKKFLLLAIIAVFSISAFSQVPISVGDKQLNFGIGNHGNRNFRSNVFYVGFDYCVFNDITIGGNLGLSFYSKSSISIITFVPAFVGDYHFNTLIGIPSEFDFYAGLDLGLPVYFGDLTGTGDLDIGTHVGGRWYWDEKWGLNLQMGLGFISGSSGFGFGLSMRM